jgi:hypothetical protein
MPADSNKCKKLIGKFGGLPGFPRDYPAAITALIEVLATKARDDTHADRIVSLIMESAERCPLVSDIIRVSREAAGHSPARSGCGECIEGWRTIWQLVTKYIGKKWTYDRITEAEARQLEPRIDRKSQEISTAVERCSCVQVRL